ncbi:MAG: cell division protein ZapA [Candidatus Cryptobacteroides sp.]
MERKIRVTILDKEYTLIAASEHQEYLMRASADSLTKLARKYGQSFSGGDEKDVLVITAFNVCMQNLTYREEIKKLQSEAEELEREFKAYLDKID